MTQDPFGTADLRAGVLTAWRNSPTRLREDAATEADLVRAGYRDRLLTELAQNAADAAVKAGIPGRVSVRLRGRALHIANTGAPLDLSGVHALTALRASGKTGTAVGRFGVGFTAVLSAGDEVEFRSTTGSLRFSRAQTLIELRDNGIEIPAGADGPAVPVLRLAWSVAVAPEAGFDSEIVVWLREDVDVAELLAAMRAEVVDLLLELPGLHSIRIEDDESWRAVEEMGNGLQQVGITAPSGEDFRWWQYTTERARWLLPLRDGRAVAAPPDVLRAPTRTDEELSLPALVIADIALQPDRRRLMPGARVAELAEGYADFARALPPADRLVLVPAPGFARSEADGLLREALVRQLRENPWLPVLAPAGPGDDPADIGVAPPGFGDAGTSGDDAAAPVRTDAAPSRASVFLGVTAELADLLATLLGPLVVPELSGRATADLLGVLDVHRIGLARVAELTGSVQRPPQWWYSLYDALEPFVTDPLAAEELGALAVPLSDGRLVTGPRTVVLDDQLEDAVAVPWARLVHPEAAHELLGRLGAQQAGVEDLLTDTALRAELDHRPDDEELREAVLGLAAHLPAGTTLPTWLGALELPDTTGELRPADELLLPAAPLAEVLVEDSPFGTLDAEVAQRYPAAALRAIGVGWGFTVVTETDPTGPDHDLDDEDRWWQGLPEDPPEFAAVRDLDLVADDAWPQALRLLLAEPATRGLLADRDGYTAWWLRRHARVDGRPLGVYRTVSDPVFADLLPELPGFTAADTAALDAVLADSANITAPLAVALLEALADPAKRPTPEAVSQTHRLLATAVPHLDLDEIGVPERVRALSGAVIDPDRALVLDRPWLGLALPPDRLVAGDIEHAGELATLLDVAAASEAVHAEVLGAGKHTTWADEPLGVLLRLQFGLPPLAGELVLHDRLEVRLTGAYEATVAVPWWRAGDTTHVQRQPSS
ncbi:sacsin N-terminal ATP-binding-like domain-containing protein [Nocardia africana]|uniref:sacsin N-terminal ATP-binding-like domain-containing protein n=1 Tax=Nocardia africana TaxID=134964 RepID=UPI000B0AA0E6|nr:ATP-binding protein [Nocardia africana]MCC3316017.1 ATP-binding protein [Nocardia africana]